jgi:DNA sulfur modification protein DndB
MDRFIGEICENKSELDSIYRKRKRDNFEKTVRDSAVDGYLSEGWEISKKNKNSTRIRKPKKYDELFEERLWALFYKLNFFDLNKDRNFRIELEGFCKGKQIDVIARDETNVFLIECKSSENNNIVNARDALEFWKSRRQEITKKIRKIWGRKCGRINLVVAISSMNKKEADDKFAQSLENKNIFLWTSKDINYIEELIKQVGGESAKYQLYSFIFSNRNQKSLKKEYPALRGRLGESYFYSFMIPAKELLKYSYVHHRNLISIPEATTAYQRMLKRSKLDEIAKFIDKEFGYFPNSIVVNFSNNIRWDKKETYDDIQMGVLTMPPNYGSTWIIDGQHRLYGAAKADRDVLLPILAFDQIDESEQANLFVDINEKQTAVPKNLLWDLYSDIYRESEDPKQIKKYHIAEVSKIMQDHGPYSGHIDIASKPATKKPKLTLSSICTTIEKYAPWDVIRSSANEKNTSVKVAGLINSYFEKLKEMWPSEWSKENESIFLSNNGFGVFFMIFQGIIKDIVHKEKASLLKLKNTVDFKNELEKYLKPAVDYLKTDEVMRKSIIKTTGRGGQSDNAVIIEMKIQEFVPNYWTVRLGNLGEQPPAQKETVAPPQIELIEDKAKEVEKVLRDFTLEILKENYGNDWWKRGIPGGLQSKLNSDWEKEIRRNPHLSKEKNQNEKKFGYLDLGSLSTLIESKQNWDFFEPYFGGKEELQRRIKDIMVLRNPVAHKRSIDSQHVVDGIAGLLWLSRNIDCTEINPYAD